MRAVASWWSGFTVKTQDKDFSTNRGTFVAIALCIALYLAWNQYLTNKYPGFGRQKETPTATTSSATQTTQQTSTSPAATEAVKSETTDPTALSQVRKLSAAELTYDTPDVTFSLSQELGSLASVKLKRYKDSNQKDSKAVDLLARPAAIQAFPGTVPARSLALPFSAEKIPTGFTFSREENNWEITQTWTLPAQGYAGKLELSFTNKAKEARPLFASVLTEVGADIETTKSSFLAPATPGEQPRFLTQIDGTDDFTNLEDFCKDQRLEVVEKNRKLDFFGIDTHYFAFALLPKAAATYRTAFSGGGAAPSKLCEISTVASSDLGVVQPQGAAKITYDVWFGPKEVELLTAFDPRLKTTLGLGWLDMIAHPLLLAIKGLYKFTGNYGFAIILLTVLLKVLFFPLTKQAAHSAAKMKKLNPEMSKIRERYKNDNQKMQMELMKFMSAHKINPMKGCLPILPTIPVFFALFRVLSASIDLRHAPFFAWITDLSAKDPYLVTPIILTVFMFIQQKMTPMTGIDKAQERILMFMPLVFGVMMITLPSGLVLYMLTNTIVSIGQQQYLNRKFANI
jgi:YidC/Oxa1 family membrane protein insertase